MKKLNEKLNFDGIFFCQASLFKIRSAGERVILLSIFRFCLNLSRSTLAVSIVDLSEMTENVETEVTLPIEMADTETQLLDHLLRCSYTETKFEIIRKRKRNIENELANLKKVQYFSQESNRPPCSKLLSWNFLQWVDRITFDGPISESMIRAEGKFYLDNSDMKDIAKSQKEFDEKRWEFTQHIMTEEEILICRKRLAMTEDEMVDKLLELQINMVTMPRERRLGLMKEIFRKLDSPETCMKVLRCKDSFELQFLSNLRPRMICLLGDHYPCRRCSNTISSYLKTCNLLV